MLGVPGVVGASTIRSGERMRVGPQMAEVWGREEVHRGSGQGDWVAEPQGSWGRGARTEMGQGGEGGEGQWWWGAGLEAYVSTGILTCPRVGDRDVLDSRQRRIAVFRREAQAAGVGLGSAWMLGGLGSVPMWDEAGEQPQTLSSACPDPSHGPTPSAFGCGQAWGSPASSGVLAAVSMREEGAPLSVLQRGGPTEQQAPRRGADWRGWDRMSRLICRPLL